MRFQLAIGIVILSLFCANGCHYKPVTNSFPISEPIYNKCITNPPGVLIVELPGSSSLTCDEQKFLVKRTNLFCKQERKDPVYKLTIFKESKEGQSTHIAVRYRCTWEI